MPSLPDDEIRIVTLERAPQLRDQVEHMQRGDTHPSDGARFGWPEFEFHSRAGRAYWPRLSEMFAGLQLAAVGRDGVVVAAGHLVPFRWDGTLETLPAGWDAVLERAFDERERRIEPTALAALAVTVAPHAQRRGHSVSVLRAMTRLARSSGMKAMVVPVRPLLKSRYPLAPIERYVEWKTPDGRPFDPWLRTHLQLGARLLRIAPRSLTIEGSIASWERWTAMAFPDSGPFVVPGALAPVMIDRERDRGTYHQPNVWLRHPLPPDEPET